MKIDSNMQFHYWTVLNKADKPSHIKTPGQYWDCQCKCGTRRIIIGYKLLSNHTKSCGCFKKEKLICKRNANLTKEHFDIIEGALLGDGSVLNYKTTPYFSYKCIYKECVDYLKNILPFQFRLYKYDAKITKICDKECFVKDSYHIMSNSDNSLHYFRNRWYGNGIKSIPPDLEISPTVMRWWFYGDGSSNRSKNKIILTLCTHGFTKSDCEILCDKIFNAINVKFMIQNDGSLVLRAKKDVIKFYEYIGVCDLPCYQYKWKNYSDIIFTNSCKPPSKCLSTAASTLSAGIS